MDTQTFWTTVALIVTALLVVAPLAHGALGGDAHERRAMYATGIVASLSFTIEAGPVAAAMTLPWLGVGATLTVRELRSMGFVQLIQAPHIAVLGALPTWCWMAAGAGWLTAHRLGIEPLGFDRSITLLTVAHFHVAGLGLSALLTVTHLRRPGRVLFSALWIHQAGMLTVAAGITFNDHLEVVGAAAITLSLSLWAAIVARWIRHELHGRARWLLAVAAIAWVVPMALALGWALGPFLPEPIVTTFMTMLRYHAALQTFGLVICGLGGLIAAEPATDPPHDFSTTIAHPTPEAHHDVARQANA